MRQLTFVEAGRVEWREAPEPRLTGADGAIVRPLAVARCDLDRPMALRGLVAAGCLDPLAIPTTVVPWSDAEQAWLEPATKLVIRRT